MKTIAQIDSKHIVNGMKVKETKSNKVSEVVLSGPHGSDTNYTLVILKDESAALLPCVKEHMTTYVFVE